jgi:hypothetical protein
MFRWLNENKELFSGGGVVLLVGIWGLFKAGYSRWKQKRDSADANVGVHVQYERLMSKGVTEKVPSFLLRAFIKPSVVASKVRIELRGETPISLSLNAEVPHLDVFFEITNLSQIDLTLDRMLVEFWFGQPTFSNVVLRKVFDTSWGNHQKHLLASNLDGRATRADRSV